MIHEAISFFNKFGLNPDGKDKSLPIMYWKQKLHKEVIGARFIIVSKKCSTKLISKVLSNAFKSSIKCKVSTVNHISIFHFIFPDRKKKKRKETSEPILEKNEKINCKANAKAIFEIWHFHTLY